MKRDTVLRLTKKALEEFPEYLGAKLTYCGEVKLNGTSYVGYKVKVSHKKPFTEKWDKMWFEKEKP